MIRGHLEYAGTHTHIYIYIQKWTRLINQKINELKEQIAPQVNFFQNFLMGRGCNDRQRRWWMIDEKVVCDNVVCVKDGV